MLKELTKIANDLDQKGLKKEADYLDDIIKNALKKNAFGGWRRYFDKEWEDPRDEGPPRAGECKDRLNELEARMPETFESFVEIVNDPCCGLACAENAALKYRSSEEYSQNELDYEYRVDALVRSKQGEEA